MANPAPQKSTTALATPLQQQLDRLAAFEPAGEQVVSLYLDMRPDEHGRDNYQTFLRKIIPDQVRSFYGDARKQVESEFERIRQYLSAELRSSANGLALFAAGRLFEPIQLDAPLEQHMLSIGPVPHLYPLARLNDQYPRYAAVLVNRNSARILVFSLGRVEASHVVNNVKTRRTAMGGWSQARYQRHVDNIQMLHVKEVVEMLAKIVTSESIHSVVVSCEETVKSDLMTQLPKHLADKVIDLVALPVAAPEHAVLAETFEALREHDADTDAAQVEALMGAWRAGGLGVVGAHRTKRALEVGQVEELLITAAPHQLGSPEVANELVLKARQTGARIRFIEDPALLADVDGVGALLRFKTSSPRDSPMGVV
jgi:peptide chain release factor subunit 1